MSSDSEDETEDIVLAVPEKVPTIEDVIQPLSNLKIDLDSQGNKNIIFLQIKKVVWRFIDHDVVGLNEVLTKCK